MRKLNYFVALALAAGALAACGGDDDDDKDKADTGATPTTETTAPETGTTAGEAPSKAEYIEQADKICQQGREETNKIAREELGGGGAPSADQYQAAAKKLLPLVQETGKQLEALPRPEGDEEELQAYYDAGFKAIEPLEKAVDDPKTAEEIFTGQTDFDAESDKLAQAYGFKVCGSD